MGHRASADEVDWAALLDAARRGDDVALGEVCERLRSYLMLVANRGLGSRLKAKTSPSDIVQLTLLEAQKDIGTFNGSTREEIRAWLRKLLEHNLADTGRRYRHTQQRDLAREVPLDSVARARDVVARQSTASSIMCRRERDIELERAVEQLSPRRRRIVELRHRDGLPYSSIAHELGITEAAARKIWSRAIQELQRKLIARNA